VYDIVLTSTYDFLDPSLTLDSYSHIGRSDSIGSGRLSIGSFSTSGPEREGYDSIDQRHSSFGSRTDAYPISGGGNYDCLDHARSQISLSVKEGHGGFGRLNRSPSGYSHIASVRLIDNDDEDE